jgi:hypothetical protein
MAEPTRILGIDPGPDSFAAVWWDGDKAEVLGEKWSLRDIAAELSYPQDGTAYMAIEDFVTYRPLDKAGRETIKNIGAIRTLYRHVEIPRADVLRHLTGGTKGGDVALRAALTDRFGGSRQAAFGTKKNPGPLYGIKGSHLLSALAVAITAWDTRSAT